MTSDQSGAVRSGIKHAVGTISGSGRVLEHANIKGGTVTDLATAKGSAGSQSGTLNGNAIIDGDYGDFFYGRDVANSVAFGHLPWIGIPDSFLKRLPASLYASYDFATAHDSRVLDQYGVTDGFTIGSPTWVAVTLDGATGTLYLNGKAAAQGAVTIRPDQLLTPNTATGGQQNYLGRAGGAAMPMFCGALDDVQFYGAALAAVDIAALQAPSSPAVPPRK